VTLDLAFIGPVVQVNTPKSPVSLPHLRHLVLTGMESAFACHSVLSGLRVPNVQRLHIIHFGVSPPHIDMLLPADFSFNPIIATTQIVDVSLHCGVSKIEVNYIPAKDVGKSWHGVAGTFVTRVPRVDDMEDNINAACKFRYDSFEFGVPGFTGFYVSFLRRFCSPRTQELVLCDPGEEVQDLPFDTRAIFAHFNSVQRLEVHNGARATSIPNVLQFLRSRLESVERSDDELVMLPSLRKISLHDFDLSEGFDDLCVFLRHRKGRLVPVEV